MKLPLLAALALLAIASAPAAADVGGACDDNGVETPEAALQADVACAHADGYACALYGDARVLVYGYYNCFVALP